MDDGADQHEKLKQQEKAKDEPEPLGPFSPNNDAKVGLHRSGFPVVPTANCKRDGQKEAPHKPGDHGRAEQTDERDNETSKQGQRNANA